MKTVMPVNTHHIQRIVPHGLSEITFYLDDLPESSDERKRISDHSIISGQLTQHHDLKVSGKLSLFSILLYPHALSRLFGIPASLLLNQSISLRELAGHRIHALEDALNRARNFSKMVTAAEAFLLTQLQQSKKHQHFRRIQQSLVNINHTRGHIQPDFLASEACLSRKQFERVFSDIIGSSPKQFLRTVRFQSALHYKANKPDINLTQLSHLSAYFDQSHMTRDFLKFSGMTPSAYFKECEPVSDYFM